MDLRQDGLDLLAGVDRLGDEWQVARDVREALGVNAAADPEPLDSAVQGRNLQTIAGEASVSASLAPRRPLVSDSPK